MRSNSSFVSPTSREQLLTVTDNFLNAFADNQTHPISLLTFFSTSSPVTIQHYPSSCPHPQSSLLCGQNAVRSYFDLLATHWTRSGLRHHIIDVDPSTRIVLLDGSITWKWNQSGRSWVEEFRITLAFDEMLSIVSFSVRTLSGPGTCVMRAKDVDKAPMTSMLNTGNGSFRFAVRLPLIFFKYHTDDVNGNPEVDALSLEVC